MYNFGAICFFFVFNVTDTHVHFLKENINFQLSNILGSLKEYSYKLRDDFLNQRNV